MLDIMCIATEPSAIVNSIHWFHWSWKVCKHQKNIFYLQSNVKTATCVGDFKSGGTLTGWKSIFKALDTGVVMIFCKREV